MPKYLVEYYASVEVEAENEEQALELGIADWEQDPDGSWEVQEVEE
jgi:hypothetical protein